MDNIMYVESIRGYPYLPYKDLANEFHVSKGTVANFAKEIEDEAKKSGRYSVYAVIKEGKMVRVNALVFADYFAFRKMLRDKNARKHVPPFRPDVLIREMGWSNRVITTDEGAEIS